MESELASRYNAMVAALESKGFERVEIDELTVFRRRTTSRLNRYDTVVGIGYEAGVATGSVFDELSQGVSDWHFLTVNRSRHMYATISANAFFVMFAESADDSAIEAAKGKAPGWPSVLCTRALVHGHDGKVEYFKGRRIFGFAVLKRLRKQLLEFLDEGHAT